jgi:hypothetical protein
MASAALHFAPPEEDNVVALRIYESSAAGGPYTEIERVTAIGTYPDYIDSYTTANANSATDWFAIAWESVGGVLGPQSVGVKGGTTTLVGKIVDRVLQRDGSLDPNIVRQEAEVSVEQWAGTSIDPYATDADVSYGQLNGLVYLTLARCYIFAQASGGETESATLGIVSMRSSSSTSTNTNTDALIALANDALGLNTSYVLQLECPASWRDRPYLVLEA